MEYIRESWLDVLAHLEDEYRSKTGVFEMANITIWKRTVGGKSFYYHMACVTARMRSDEIGCHAWTSSMVAEGVNCQYCGRDIHKNPRKVQSKVQKQYANPFEVGMTVRITGPCFTGQVGELQVIDPENIDSCDFFGVYLDSVEKVVPFAADEIERVEAEQEKPHPDACLCNECWAFRFAVCGYDD